VTARVEVGEAHAVHEHERLGLGHGRVRLAARISRRRD
jgi:hypothetical protein